MLGNKKLRFSHVDLIFQGGRWSTWWTRGCRPASPRLRCCRSSVTPVMPFLACTSANHPSSTETLRWHILRTGCDGLPFYVKAGKNTFCRSPCCVMSWLTCFCELKLCLIMESSKKRGGRGWMSAVKILWIRPFLQTPVNVVWLCALLAYLKLKWEFWV